MENNKDIDSYFANTGLKRESKSPELDRRHKLIKGIELLFPSIAAILFGLLIIIPHAKQSEESFGLDITLPKQGELEKLHVESSELFITDKDNKVNEFNADNIDETAPGSKLIKLSNPKGKIPTLKGPWYNIEAPTGYYDQNKNTLKLEQNVKMTYSEGYTATTEAMEYDFQKNFGLSTTPTHGEGAAGQIDSQGFKFYKNQNLLIFTGKTHIIIKEEQLKGNK